MYARGFIDGWSSSVFYISRYKKTNRYIYTCVTRTIDIKYKNNTCHDIHDIYIAYTQYISIFFHLVCSSIPIALVAGLKIRYDESGRDLEIVWGTDDGSSLSSRSLTAGLALDTNMSDVGVWHILSLLIEENGEVSGFINQKAFPSFSLSNLHLPGNNTSIYGTFMREKAVQYLNHLSSDTKATTVMHGDLCDIYCGIDEILYCRQHFRSACVGGSSTCGPCIAGYQV